MFVAFTSANSLSEERSTQKFVFPYAKGSSFIGISYFSTLFTDIGTIGNYIPYKLVSNANSFNNLNSLKSRCIYIHLLCYVNHFNHIQNESSRSCLNAGLLINIWWIIHAVQYYYIYSSILSPVCI
jgi:hypothetical protein